VLRGPLPAVTSTPVPQRPGAVAPTGTAAARRAGAGELREEHLESQVLGRRMPYLIWLPPGYTPSRRYPVVYLLHGAGDGESPGRAEWMNLGISDALNEAVATGELPPAIVVFPEGQQGYWINHAAGGPRWADYVVQDVVRHVDRTWATDARPERRAIGGLSMGGHGALHLALTYPDVFRVAGAHSPALRRHDESPPFFGDAAWFARFDPLSLAAPGAPSRLRVWLDVGEGDRWRRETEEVAAALKQGGAKVELRVLKGRHEGAYWRAHLRDYLRFYGGALAER
jgi:enterochelin esterase-like enzyme